MSFASYVTLHSLLETLLTAGKRETGKKIPIPVQDLILYSKDNDKIEAMNCR